jgi:hypothetical protein
VERAALSPIHGERASTFERRPPDFNLKPLCNLKRLPLRARAQKA